MPKTMTVPAHPVKLPASDGPFRCDNCTFANATATRCSHPEIVRLYDGVIEPGECSDYFTSKKKAAKKAWPRNAFQE